MTYTGEIISTCKVARLRKIKRQSHAQKNLFFATPICETKQQKLRTSCGSPETTKVLLGWMHSYLTAETLLTATVEGGVKTMKNNDKKIALSEFIQFQSTLIRFQITS